MHKILITLALIATIASTTYGQAPEYITVPVEAISLIEGNNFHKARQEAIAKAFETAVWLAAAGVTPPGELEYNQELIQANLVSKASDYVFSYKFLEEVTDPASGELLVRLQVTLFLDSVRKILGSFGVRSKKRKLPKLVIVIREQSVGFASGSNFLLLTSLSEEVLAKNFQQRGYEVADRKDIRKSRLDKLTLDAMKGDKASIMELTLSLKADMLILGSAKVTVTPADTGENIEVTIQTTVRNGVNGDVLLREGERGSGIFESVLTGSLQAISATAQNLSRSLAESISSRWREMANTTAGSFDDSNSVEEDNLQ